MNQPAKKPAIKKVAVIGAGFMGAGIAQVCAHYGYAVQLYDSENAALDSAMAGMRFSVDKLHTKGWLAEDADTIMARVRPAAALAEMADADLVVEAVFEDLALKQELLRQVEGAVGEGCVFASNTSSIPITRLADVLEKPQRFLGLHFFGPVPFMQLVEVIAGAATAPAVFETGLAFVASLGKHAVPVRRDIPGFVMNRIFAAAFRECQELVAQGVTSLEDIDTGMRLGYGWRIGPFEIADNAGLDTFLRVGRSMEALQETQLYSKCGMVEKLVEQGKLGKKSGEGFYRYDSKGKKQKS